MNRVQSAFLAILLAFGIGYTPVAYKSIAHKATVRKFEQAKRQTVWVSTPAGSGSAVVVKRVNPEGRTRWFAWTAAHVVEECTRPEIVVFIRTEGRKVGFTTFQAALLTIDKTRDLALLAIDAPADAFASADFADDSVPTVGQSVFSCGNFLGQFFEGSVGTGIISQVGVNPGVDWPWQTVDQTTCPVYPGSSGGPMFNADGKVIGIVVGRVDSTLNFFVPVRAMAELSFNWALWGTSCPADADIRAALVKPAPKPVLPPAVEPVAPKSKRRTVDEYPKRGHPFGRR